ncbi:hypothetical protein V8B55DRAFT_1488860 [Mucor lusitanicus]|uniref:SAP domain-containing protein n=2 Tax=Mucor circinelloides f. lusitanicus TaxID=29924 RepID=A0A168M3A6_MUCCL|nr:hypothetical protein FB192DRAFT_1364380 [Mucor lusitanicus]OAD04323.1 hypothetical protein MUCCIDRAFT_79440 [Mucor lusitanicus CBS 277.49]
MLNRSKLIQQRAFHCSLRVYEEWTKAGLRRMKKNDLIQLAKENHLNISGTKNDIIIQLLSHQTAKIVGSTTPTLHSIRKVVDKSDEPAAPLQDTVDADNEWMKAFEMKVAQRGSRKPMSESREHFTGGNTSSKPHPFNDAVKTTIVKPVAEQVKLTTPPSTTVASIIETLNETKSKTSAAPRQEQHTKPSSDTVQELDGMDPAWVEAFDLKVGSRGARHHLTDTLSPSTPTLSTPVDELPFIKLDPSDKEHHPSTTTADKQEPASSNKDNTAAADQPNKTWINTLVGTGMLAWYFGGEEGISNVWHFLTSSG